ncbi:Gfo/Idh/MocA family protein [Fuerstiella marisgermanici]|uniref:Inositol 2-dehydrogenase n=1 Tax=Fuerstiella marisgermanici TaxID=1891926 RepID=A0A1P8WJH6_9PLAN|nr:Gfo/Idh/MocA family oxidoreductase [Fuerstiella marisgermanici]APZ94216.1 Inositol 2-dehydrogenase [Fuerstiella marisgermanici]
MPSSSTRRNFLATTTAATGMLAGFPLSAAATAQDKPRAKVERAGVGAIGLRYQGSVIANKAAMYGDIVAVCDVDKNVRDPVKSAFGSTPRDFENYQDLLARKDVDIVTIGAPDHWHTKMVIDACRAGKDVYCEKPLTLTIDEGKVLRDVVQETGRVVQVGSWQRSDHRFRQAVEMVRQGRIGKLQKVDIVLGKNVTGGPFEKRRVPLNFNWNLWQGQTPDTPYLAERGHYTFRWWYEYSGGQMTDWGAHHLDIAQWAINSYPVEISGTAVYPNVPDGYNVAIDFSATYKYENGVVMTVSDTGRNGIMFTGDEGRIFVNRGSLQGKPVEDLKSTPLTRDDWTVYDFDNLQRPERAGKLEAIINHMGNFFDCVQSRNTPVSDVESQHRSVSTCHLGNIAMKVGRTLKWDPKTETFPHDADANTHLKRNQRDGFETA